MKLKRKSILTIVLACMLFCLLPYNVSAAENNQDIEQDFEELQETITDSLLLSEGNYAYDETYIRSLINDFDVAALNEKYNLDWTNDSLADAMILSIQNTKPSIQTYGRWCDTTYEHPMYGWNYDRYVEGVSSTTKWIAELRRIAIQDDHLGDISDLFGQTIGFVTNIISLIDKNYKRGLANALEAKNYNECGTVTDINRFTAGHTVWNQKEFN